MRKLAVGLAALLLMVAAYGCGGTDYYKEGQRLLQEGSYEEAMAMFDEVLATNGSNSNAWLGRGDCLYYMGKYREAVDSFVQALWEQAGSHPEMRDALEKALIEHPDDDNLWTLKGDYLRQKTQSGDDAVQCYMRAIEINPRNGSAWYGVYYVLDDTGQREAAEAWRLKGIQAGIF